ncbi:CRISPR-associated helicase/endonuclease Cas3 [Candidatus Poribacteria bacterium]|nr:MAG: CRISPR-associated helicase/endonuclease Cas3 [Candidatus Poribacteria bacterium]
MVVYARSRPLETLADHIGRLLEGLREMRTAYGEAILRRVPEAYRPLFWEALELIVKCHDLGKITSHFQNLIRRSIGEPRIPEPDVPRVPHGLLSPAFIQPLVEGMPEEIQRAIYQAIAFHHPCRADDYIYRWREVREAIEEELALVWEERLSDVISKFSLDLGVPKPNYRWLLTPPISPREGDLYRLYVPIKGLLHRLDHSASAHLPAEEKPIPDPADRITNYLLGKGIPEESIWQRELASELSSRNVVLIASTGIGKTEFALYWLGEGKGFYVLPVRTSVNAMFDRLRETFRAKDRVGLLHSDSYFYLLSRERSEELLLSVRRVDEARQLSMPLTVSTADQLFPAVFKYGGYEKIYATLAYSKVIVDEIQSYDPEITAAILKGLAEIAEMGGLFCIVTATLPGIYREYLEEKVQNLKVLPPRYHRARKHKVKIEGAPIDSEEGLSRIVKLQDEYGKVLVIVNTVRKAQALYRKLREFKPDLPLSLLHSGFIYRDRRCKEAQILDRNARGIWITTQLAEVSLNIDFPVLLTEIATVDSLIQRMGRVLRFIEPDFAYDGPPNVFIYEEASGIGTVYDEEIVQKTREVLREVEGIPLEEERKAELIERIFNPSSLEGTRYYMRFRKSLKLLELLENNPGLAETKGEAQRLFRRMSNITVIPAVVYEQHRDEIERALDALEDKKADRLTKIRALFTLREFSVSIPASKVKKEDLGNIPRREDLFLVEIGYDPQIGLELSTRIGDDF